MRLVIPVNEDNGADSTVCEHFGRTPYFAVIDVLEDKGEVRFAIVENPLVEHSPGAVPALLKEWGADVIVARGMGMRAKMFFNQLGIEVITGAEGTIKQIVEQLLSGNLESKPYEVKDKLHGHGGHCQ